MSEYNGNIEIISGLTPANNGDFPVAQAKDICIGENEKRLDTKLNEIDEALENIESYDIATEDQALSGTDDTTIMTPAKVNMLYQNIKNSQSSTNKKILELLSKVAYVEDCSDIIESLTSEINTTSFTIVKNLKNVSLSNDTYYIKPNQSYTTELKTSGYFFISKVSVIMDNKDITSTVYSNKTINIPNVTADLQIIAKAVYKNTQTVSTEYCAIVKNTENIEFSSNLICIKKGSSFTTTISPKLSYTIEELNISMGGIDITDKYIDSTLTIDSVTDDIIITAKASLNGMPTDGLMFNFDFRNADIYRDSNNNIIVNDLTNKYCCVNDFSISNTGIIGIKNQNIYIKDVNTHELLETPIKFTIVCCSYNVPSIFNTVYSSTIPIDDYDGYTDSFWSNNLKNFNVLTLSSNSYDYLNVYIHNSFYKKYTALRSNSKFNRFGKPYIYFHSVGANNWDQLNRITTAICGYNRILSDEEISRIYEIYSNMYNPDD